MDPIALGLLTTIAGLWLTSVEWRIRSMSNRMSNTPTRSEVKEDIDLRLESIRVLQQETKEDIKEIRDLLREIRNG